MNLDHTQIEVKDIDHLGIIAGIMDEMDLVKIIDELIPPHPLEKISAGVAIKAMVLNCMGFLTSPFYLFPKFFEGKAVEHLLGENIKVEYLNESRFGRVQQIPNQSDTQQLLKSLLYKGFSVPLGCRNRCIG